MGPRTTYTLSHHPDTARGRVESSAKSRTSKPGDAVHERAGIGGQVVGAPGDVAVGANQDEPALVEFNDLRLVKVHDLERHPPIAGGTFKCRGVAGVAAEAQECESLPEQVSCPGGPIQGLYVGYPSTIRA